MIDKPVTTDRPVVQRPSTQPAPERVTRPLGTGARQTDPRVKTR